MAASVGWLIDEAGIRFPGMLSNNPPIAFADMPTGLAAWAAVPDVGKWQIVLTIGAIELANEMRKPVCFSIDTLVKEGLSRSYITESRVVRGNVR